jgi:hypothetical protein
LALSTRSLVSHGLISVAGERDQLVDLGYLQNPPDHGIRVDDQPQHGAVAAYPVVELDDMPRDRRCRET